MNLVKLPTNYKTKKIKNIKVDYNVPTYDIEVDNTHYYTTDIGMVSHNTLSLMFQDSIFSYGIEPAFGIYFWKRTRISGKYEYYFCVPSVVKEYFAKNGFIIPMKGDAIKDTWDGKHGTPIAKFIDSSKNLSFH